MTTSALQINNLTDASGNPTGGLVTGKGFHIEWQNGPLGKGEDRKEPNGASIETVIFSIIQRLEFFQKHNFNCRENAIAITKLQEASMWLGERTKRRMHAGTAGTHEGS